MWFNLKQLLLTSATPPMCLKSQECVKSAMRNFSDSGFVLFSQPRHTLLGSLHMWIPNTQPVNRKLDSFPSRCCPSRVGEKKKGCKEVRSSMCWFAHSRSDHCRSPTDHLYHGPLIDFGPDGRPGHIYNWRSMWSLYIFIKRDPKIILVELSIV